MSTGLQNGIQTPAPLTFLPGFEHMNRYWDKYYMTYCVKIVPGEYYVSTQPEMIVTTLGSCVSACVRDPINKIGGMNHFMLPGNNKNTEKYLHPSVSFANRYGNFAMENLINDILKNGGERKYLEIKLFGGGKILSHFTDIGKFNIEFVENYVMTEGLNLIAKDLGSVFPRKIVYDPLSGIVKLKKLRSLRSRTILEREKRYLKDIRNQPLEGAVELFWP